MINTSNDAKVFAKASKTLRVLAHPDRLKIIDALRSKRLSVGELAGKLRMPQAVASKHLLLLKTAGVLTSRADCNFRYYSLANAKVLDVLNCIKKSCSKEE